jgi:hypothetical protein
MYCTLISKCLILILLIHLNPHHSLFLWRQVLLNSISLSLLQHLFMLIHSFLIQLLSFQLCVPALWLRFFNIRMRLCHLIFRTLNLYQWIEHCGVEWHILLCIWVLKRFHIHRLFLILNRRCIHLCATLITWVSSLNLAFAVMQWQEWWIECIFSKLRYLLTIIHYLFFINYVLSQILYVLLLFWFLLNVWSSFL